MAIEYENNLSLVGASLLVASALWAMARQISKKTIRRVINTSLAFLAFPLVYLGHPVLLYQVWMLIPLYVAQAQFIGLMVLAAVWAIVVGASLRLLKRN